VDPRDSTPKLDRDLFDHLGQGRLTRRQLLWRVSAVGLSASALGSLLAACGSSNVSATGATSAGQLTGSPRVGGILTAAFESEPQNLDPAVDWELTGGPILETIYQGLLRYRPVPGQAGTQLEPCLATEVPSPTNGGKTYTFHIRDGVRFQAPVSRQVTAADFKYSFERMMKMPLAPATYFYMEVVGAQAYQSGKATHVEGFKVIDPSTLQIDLTQPDPAFLNALTMNFCYVVPREWVQKWGNRGFARHPLGTGPFVFDHWTPAQEIVVNKNPDYWEPGKPYLDGLKFLFSMTSTTALLRLERGDVDVLGDGVPPAQIPSLQVNPTWKSQVFSQPQIAGIYLSLNQQFKPFDNVQVRQALSWAINRERLCKLQSGEAEPLWQFLPQGMPGAEPGKRYYGYDPAKAKQLLAQAGFPNGFSTTLYCHNVDPFPKLAQSIQNDLAAVGVKASLRTLDRNTYYAVQSTPHKMPMSITEWYMDYPDPSDFVVALASKSNAINGGMNNSFWWDPEVEKLLVSSASLPTQERYAAYTKMQQIIMQNAPYVTLFQPVMTTMCSKATGGFFLSEVAPWYDFADYWRVQ